MTYDPRAPGALYPSLSIDLVPKKVQVRVWRNVVCSMCGEQQQSVFPDASLQIKDGLLLTVEGGYGMYVDSDIPYQLLLCGACTAYLREAWVGFDQVLTEADNEF